MPRPLVVLCCICWREYNPSDPAVEYRSLDAKWWCRDETSCTERRARADATLAEALKQMGQ